MALPRVLRAPFAVIGLIATLVVVLLAVRYANASAAGGVDRWFQSQVVGQPEEAFRLAVWVDFLGEPLGLALSITLLATACLVLGRPRLAVLAAAAPLLSGAVTTVLKPAVGRTINGGNLAYPSGHTAALAALGMVLALLLVTRRDAGWRAASAVVLAVAAACGVVMGWAQVYLNAHYPTDALGGFCTALVVVPLTAVVLDALAIPARRLVRSA